MKFSDNTIEILKNFASLNEGIIINQGSLLVTLGGKDIFARATVNDIFPRRCAIANLPKVLGILSIMSDADIEFEEHQLVISSGSQVVRLTYAEESSINAPKSDDLKVPLSDVSFPVSANDLTKLIRGASVLGLPEIAVTGDGASITLRAVNVKDKTADSFAVRVGETDKTFKMIFKVDRLSKILNRDYTFTLSKHGVTKMAHADIAYMVAADPINSEAGDL